MEEEGIGRVAGLRIFITADGDVALEMFSKQLLNLDIRNEEKYTQPSPHADIWPCLWITGLGLTSRSTHVSTSTMVADTLTTNSSKNLLYL